MKKIYFSILSVLVLSIGLQAQNVTKGVAFTTGGAFGAPNNFVRVYAMETDSFMATQIDSVLGDFSNQILVDGQFAYAHVGRGGGNPAGADRIYKYDLLNFGPAVDSTQGIPGIQSFELSGNNLIISRGYPAVSNYIEVVDKNNLQTSLFTDNTATGACNGIAVMNNRAYVASTDYVMNSGVVHVLGLGSTVTNEGMYVLDSLSMGANELYSENGMLYMTSLRYAPDYSVWYAGMTQINTVDSTFTTDTTGFTSTKGFDFYNGTILGNFGNPIETYDVNTKIITPLFSRFVTTAKKDPNANRYATLETDYFSIGEVIIYDGNGTALGSAVTDISGTALSMVTNNIPLAVNDTVLHNLGSLPNLSPFMMDVLINDTDLDGDSLFIEEVLSANALIVGNEIEYNPTNTGAAPDTFSYVTSDVWGDLDTATVYLDFATGVNEVSNNQVVKLFPNPAQSWVNISVANGNIENVTILDLTGRIVSQGSNSNAEVILDVTQFNSGVYIIQVTVDGKIETHQLIVK